ncbi:hypothetical protein KDA_60530 [Dictyobacter alpinus]|uniref:DUF58 domain-containing protein n=1 Tax=Dictyobacter alpinus TaxID=2014873 RepID=A0A402BGW3_9CHLR|nr:DUF58 domain-containing protein [Dictyobacter alpinus]GCE30569.1 hypothetical protein KDA_60530 [Dictyobacter alpinus]
MWGDKKWRQLFSGLSTASSVPELDDQSRGSQEFPERLLQRLNWHLLRPLASHLGGSEHSQFLGPGVEFSEIRAYQPGDDIRFIDWNISARTEQPMVREAHVERAVDVWFLIDVSASTRWGTAQCLKSDCALDFLAIAGQLLNRAGNRLGAVIFAEQPLAVFPPALGRLHLLHLLARLKAVKTDCAGPTNLIAALNKAYVVLRRRSLIVIVSDFLVEDGWQLALGKLAQRHEVVAVRLMDPREGALPDVGLVWLEDPETGQQLYVDTGDAKLRARFSEAALRQEEYLRMSLARCRVELLQIGTDQDLISAMVHFLQRRQHNRTRKFPLPQSSMSHAVPLVPAASPWKGDLS